MPLAERFPLPARLHSPAAAELATSLVALRGRDLVMDGADCGPVGALCLQVLLCAAASWERDGYRLRLAAPSSELSESLTLLGVPSGSPLLQPEEPR